MKHTIALRFAYDGGAFQAYARDPALDHTVEGALVAAATREGYIDGSWRTGSRTDAGVSARYNVVRLSLHRPHLRGLVPALNSSLPDGLWATGAAAVPDEWNPRHAASRTYRYWYPMRDEDGAAMQAAADAFVGDHDFTAFCRMEEGRSPQRRIDAFTVQAAGTAWRFEVTGPNFLWNQVRRMVGAILAAGQGTTDAVAIETMLASGAWDDRIRLAPPDGLLLWDLAYPGLEWSPGQPAGRRLLARWQRAQVQDALLDALMA